MVTATPEDFVSTQRVHRACWAVAIVLTLGWALAFDHFRPDYLVDEPGHLGNIYHFLEGKPGWPEQMTMLPGYHYTVAALWHLHPPFKLLTLARLVAMGTAMLGLLAFGRAWTRLHGRPAGPAVLLLALLPILQPFTGLAYTDVPALAFALLGVGAHLASHRVASVLFFAAAVCFRQTNVIWAGFLVALEFFRLDAPRREFWERTRWLLFFLAACAVAVAAALILVGRLTPGAQTGNDLRFNPASPHFAGLLVLLLGFPVWLAALPAAWGNFGRALRARPAITLAVATAALAVAALLALTFANPHPWNRDLSWDGCTFTLLRNWPLVWLDTHPWLRVISGLNVVLMGVALALTFARQSRRRELWLALAVGALLPLTNGLVEPRYYIPVAAFVLLFLDLAPVQVRRLACWWLLLCAVHAPFIAAGRSLW